MSEATIFHAFILGGKDADQILVHYNMYSSFHTAYAHIVFFEIIRFASTL
jgi:hypothetical protein